MSEPLAIDGGAPLCAAAPPGRHLFGEEELAAVREVFEHAWREDRDFGYQGDFEQRYTEQFCTFQGGGYADAVASGTASILLGLAALDLPRGSTVVVSPVTDPGGVMPVFSLGLNARVADAAPGSFNMGADQLQAVVTPDTRAVIITHLGGIPADLDPLLAVAAARGIAVIEDCSQAHGALYHGRRVGTYGDLAGFSTMFSKNHASGGCGGLVYTRRRDLYQRVRSLADRGKPFFAPDFDPKDPRMALFPALNWNQDELSCAIGSATLAKLPDTIARRNEIAAAIRSGLAPLASVHVPPAPAKTTPSPFFLTVEVDASALTVSKARFAAALAAEGVWLNPEYNFVVSEWRALWQHSRQPPQTPNAVAYKECTINLLYHERFREQDVEALIRCFHKVDAAYRR